MSYDIHKVEKKWQQQWAREPLGQTKSADSGKKYYCLDMFPYPSGSGLHVGHWRGYVLSDVYARIKWLQGYNILHPMGWDAFGLPAENDAIKKGINPAISTAHNIAVFKKQLQEVAALYDWSHEINTTDPQYYKWTQWIFFKMYKAGLAYESEAPINWCPSCLTGLANEEVVNGGCERCGTQVTQKNINQWVLKITDYAQKLLDGLDTLEWPEKVKIMQRNWIGKSEGALIVFTVEIKDGKQIELPVYTTTPCTLFGVTFLVMAPDHELVKEITTKDHELQVAEYQKKCNAMSTIERMENKEKTGVFTGAYAKNPINSELVPIYIASYVLKDFGSGIVMGVPAHDERDFEFAQKFKLPIKQVIESSDVVHDGEGNMLAAYEGDGTLIQSGAFNGELAKSAGNKKITEWLELHNAGHVKVTYRLRDWIFSRQRYWGEPIPIIHCKACGAVPVPEDQLPVILPDVEQYQPTGTGQSPLAAIDWWVNTVCPTCGGAAKRETNTMPQWAGSSWYFLRYPNVTLENKPFDEKDMEYWLPVDLYVGGIEHAILHLLYARFYVKFLYDMGYVPFNEPFTHLFNQGMVCKYSEKSGLVEKMSKSKGNVVNPDEIVKEFGSDALRMYILFMGPPELDCEWQDSGMEGMRRFLNRLWDFLTNPETIVPEEQEAEATKKRVHAFLKTFQDRLINFKPNTALSATMEFLNDAQTQSMRLSRSSVEHVLVSVSVLAPHIASELLEKLLGKKLQECTWPVYDARLAITNQVTIAVQVNGKLRGDMVMPRGVDRAQAQSAAQALVEKWLHDKTIVNVIFVPDRLINFVVK